VFLPGLLQHLPSGRRLWKRACGSREGFECGIVRNSRSRGLNQASPLCSGCWLDNRHDSTVLNQANRLAALLHLLSEPLQFTARLAFRH